MGDIQQPSQSLLAVKSEKGDGQRILASTMERGQMFQDGMASRPAVFAYPARSTIITIASGTDRQRKKGEKRLKMGLTNSR